MEREEKGKVHGTSNTTPVTKIKIVTPKPKKKKRGSPRRWIDVERNIFTTHGPMAEVIDSN